jgi:hypothetical protein
MSLLQGKNQSLGSNFMRGTFKANCVLFIVIGNSS